MRLIAQQPTAHTREAIAVLSNPHATHDERKKAKTALPLRENNPASPRYFGKYPQADLATLPSRYKDKDAFFSVLLDSTDEICLDFDCKESKDWGLNLIDSLDLRTFTTFSTSKDKAHAFFKLGEDCFNCFTSAKTAIKARDLKGIASQGEILAVHADEYGEIKGSLVFGCGYLAENGLYEILHDEPIRTLNADELEILLEMLISFGENSDELYKPQTEIIAKTANNAAQVIETRIERPKLTKWALSVLNKGKISLAQLNFLRDEVMFKYSYFNRVNLPSQFKTPFYPLKRNSQTLNNELELLIMRTFANNAILGDSDEVIYKNLEALMLIIDKAIFNKPLSEDGTFTLNAKQIKARLENSKKRVRVIAYKDAEAEAKSENEDIRDKAFNSGCFIGKYAYKKDDKKGIYFILHLCENNTKIRKIVTTDKERFALEIARDELAKKLYLKRSGGGKKYYVRDSDLYLLEIQEDFSDLTREVIGITQGEIIINTAPFIYHPRVRDIAKLTQEPVSKGDFYQLNFVKFLLANIFSENELLTFCYTLRETLLRRKPIPYAFAMIGEGKSGKNFVFDFLNACILANDSFYNAFYSRSPFARVSLAQALANERFIKPYLQVKSLLFDEGQEVKGGNLGSRVNEYNKKFCRQKHADGEAKFADSMDVDLHYFFLGYAFNLPSLPLKNSDDNTRLIFCKTTQTLNTDELKAKFGDAQKQAEREGDAFLAYILGTDSIDDDFKQMLSDAKGNLRAFDSYNVINAAELEISDENTPNSLYYFLQGITQGDFTAINHKDGDFYELKRFKTQLYSRFSEYFNNANADKNAELNLATILKLFKELLGADELNKIDETARRELLKLFNNALPKICEIKQKRNNERPSSFCIKGLKMSGKFDWAFAEHKGEFFCKINELQGDLNAFNNLIDEALAKEGDVDDAIMWRNRIWAFCEKCQKDCKSAVETNGLKTICPIYLKKQSLGILETDAQSDFEDFKNGK